jgi:TolA-binding protein
MGLLLLGLDACKTSGDVRVGKNERNDVDPSGIRTLESAPDASGEGRSAPPAAATARDAEALERQLEATKGELENLRYQIEQERQQWQLRNIENEAEKKRMQEALARVSQAPAPAAGAADVSGGDSKNAAELLWKQGLELTQKKSDTEALASMKSLLANYPKSKHGWGANLVAGMLEYRMKNFKGAAIHFNQAIDMSAKRSVGPSLAWYFQGLAFLKMEKKEDAKLFLGELDRKFPKTEANAKAKKILAAKAKAPADLFADVPNWLDFVGP